MTETRTKTAKSPIIFIPGIMGSRLYDQTGSLVWVEYSLKLTKLGEMMGMQNTLTVKNNEIDQVILPENQREYGALGPFEYPYKKIVDLLCDVFPENGVYFYSYDFRQTIADSADLLHNQIQNIQNITGEAKVDLIAHSLGGLIVSAYLEGYGNENIEKAIILATPYEGSPDTINTALTGEMTYIPGSVLDTVTKITRDVRTSFPSAAELIPTDAYTGLHPPYLYTENIPFSDDMRERENIFSEGEPYYTPAGITREAGVNVYNPIPGNQYEMILKKIFGEEQTLRRENNSRIITDLERSYFAVGINRQTIRSLMFSDDPLNPEITHIIYDHAGDGSVPEESATMYGYLETLGKDQKGNSRLLKIDTEHGGITNHGKVLDWIVAILSDVPTDHIQSDPTIEDNTVMVKIAGHQEILSKLHKLVTSMKNQKNTQ
ncbi:PGAP1 family protein [Methanocorpusculum labreanum Z]|uniref:PGAP1 family protein n=1 Tax=Methanocorpusculum labreanum (strain ATCC 43576 / DSM 4855 / Z) TaxID=410358 RepID=A2SQ51_METLZ|nr:alpha/beta hydrolase [Methanocorpusculum labreanum]ABN06457.1 PGAP1 family protein [Methanocorpusculum labreanum Z]